MIPEWLAELEGLTDVVTSSLGIQIVDTVFFTGDKPAAQFEAGMSHVVGIIHALVVPAIVIAFQTSPMRPTVHRDSRQKFRKLLLQGTLERCQGASSSMKDSAKIS